jgi:hypothetical protein
VTVTNRIPILLLLTAIAGSTVGWQIHGSADEPAKVSNSLSDPTDAISDSTEPAAGAKKPKHRSQSLRGQVVWLADAMLKRYGIETDADAAHAQVALDADDGMLYPIIKDFRGRAFHVDERLRDVEMELLVRRYDGSPLVQVLRIYTLKPEGKYELDYWCDVCAIPMYELKECECCQGPIRIRERLVEKGTDTKGKTKGTKP